jgi:cell wall-associated NlpC family hydrolase
MGKVGSPYVWGAAGPSTFDCSGLVVWAFAQAGRPGLPHSTYSLINMGVPVPMDQLQVGDLLFNDSVGHVAIYVGNNSFVHAPHSGDVVKVTSLSDYYLGTARRI